MADCVAQTVFDDAITALAAMGRESGYQRDYAGAIGLPRMPHEEEDFDCPLVQVTLGGVPKQTGHGNEIAYDYHRHRQEFFVSVNVGPVVRMIGGRPMQDLTLPIWQVRTDVHAALFVDRTRGVGGHVTTFYVGPEEPKYFGVVSNDVETVGGVTVIERYAFEWAHLTGDMTTAA